MKSAVWLTSRRSLHTTTFLRAEVNLLSPHLAKLGSSSQISNDIREYKSHANKLVVDGLHQIISNDLVAFRKEEYPWRVLIKPRRHRIVDMVGILGDDHRVEMEQIAQRMQALCDVEIYVVVVPTVGLGKARVFAQSLFYEWGIGKENCNGVLLLLSQHEASLQLVSSYTFDEYFGEKFANLLVSEILQPCLLNQDPSYGLLQVLYAIARHSQEIRELWKPKFLTIHQKNQLRFAQQTFYYGVFHTKYFWLTLASCIITAIFWMKILDITCKDCGVMMLQVKNQDMINDALSSGQKVEIKNECSEYRVFMCPKCLKYKVLLVFRDYHNYHKCLQCQECKYFTTSVRQDILRLPTKSEDGVKLFQYHCDHCHLDKKVPVPLYRPIEENPKEWYDFLIQRSQSPNAVVKDRI
eukprot:PhF_6_TR25826/c1_g1_i1/m.36471